MEKSLMIRKIYFLLIVTMVLTGCSGQPVPVQATPTTASACPDLMKVANSFYAENDSARRNQTLSHLTEDVILVFWAEGINGHHMTQKVVIGKDQMAVSLEQPGLHLKSAGQELPNYLPDNISQVGNQLKFNLTPDRAHADGRPYNPFVIEIIFSGCRMDIIKIVERVTWV
jgi:hypothetical protein